MNYMFKVLRKPTATDSEIAKLFDALGDPTRLKVMCLLLKKKELCVGEITEEIGISMSGISQQLKILESSGLVTRSRSGQKVCYFPNLDNPKSSLLIECIKTLKKG